MFQASNKFQNDLDEIRMQMSKQKKRSLEMDVQLRQNRTKVARLENLVKQTNVSQIYLIFFHGAKCPYENFLTFYIVFC